MGSTYVQDGDLVILANYYYFWPNNFQGNEQKRVSQYLTPDCSPFVVTYNNQGAFSGSSKWGCCYCHCSGSFAAGWFPIPGATNGTPVCATLQSVKNNTILTPQTPLKIIKLKIAGGANSDGTIDAEDTYFTPVNEGGYIYIGDIVGIQVQLTGEVFRVEDSCGDGCDDTVFASSRTWESQNICSHSSTCSNCVGNCSHQSYAVFVFVDQNGSGAVVDDSYKPPVNTGGQPLAYGCTYYIQSVGKMVGDKNPSYVKCGDSQYGSKLSIENLGQLFGTTWPQSNTTNFAFRIYQPDGNLPV